MQQELRATIQMECKGGQDMCALSEDSLIWEILNKYSIEPSKMSFSETVMKIAGENLVSPADVSSLLKQFYGEESWKE